MDPGVTIGYGWIIRNPHREFVSEAVQDAFAEAPKNDFASWCNEKLKGEGIDVVAEAFGYEFNGVALLAAQTRVEFFRWDNDYSKAPVISKWNHGLLTAELQDALDFFGLYEARLGEPSWHLLVTYA